MSLTQEMGKLLPQHLQELLHMPPNIMAPNIPPKSRGIHHSWFIPPFRIRKRVAATPHTATESMVNPGYTLTQPRRERQRLALTLSQEPLLRHSHLLQGL